MYLLDGITLATTKTNNEYTYSIAITSITNIIAIAKEVKVVFILIIYSMQIKLTVQHTKMLGEK